MTDSIALRSSFLKEASHLLAVSSPSVCAFIGAEKGRLLAEANVELPLKEDDADRRSTCSSCGNLLIPGWSCQVAISSDPQHGRRRSQEASKSTAKRDTNVVYRCLRCDRRTERMLYPQARRRLKTPTTSISSTLEIRSSKKADDAKPKTANASSKQRQKARKGGLQAMLERNKLQTSKLGLDLMDFAM